MQGIKNVKIHFKLITHAGYNSFCNSIGKFLFRKATARRECACFFLFGIEGKVQTLREVAGMVLLLLRLSFLKFRSYSWTVLTDTHTWCVINMHQDA